MLCWIIPLESSGSRLTVPSLAAPVVSGKFIALPFDATTAGAVALLSLGLVLLDAHIGIPKAYYLFCTTLAGFHYELLPALYFTAGNVALHF